MQARRAICLHDMYIHCMYIPLCSRCIYIFLPLYVHYICILCSSYNTYVYSAAATIHMYTLQELQCICIPCSSYTSMRRSYLSEGQPGRNIRARARAHTHTHTHARRLIFTYTYTACMCTRYTYMHTRYIYRTSSRQKKTNK